MSRTRLLVLCFGAVIAAATATASPFSAVVAYGDSLSDNGNFFAAVGQPGFPYFEGRASNGPVAVELLAAALGDPLLDFAWLGATTGVGNHLDPGGTATTVGTNGLPGMAPLYASSLPVVTPIASSALFVLWGGADDFLSPSPLDPTPIDVADRAVANLAKMAGDLRALGANHIVVLGLPDLGSTPFGSAGGPDAADDATALSTYFNMRLMASLPAGVVFFDTAALLRKVVNNAAAYGLTNVTDACFDPLHPGPVCSTPNQYLFFDDLHPSARGHEILAAELAATAVPEPATFGLSGLVLVALVARRRSIRNVL